MKPLDFLIYLPDMTSTSMEARVDRLAPDIPDMTSTSREARVDRLARSRSSFCCSSSLTYLVSLSLMLLISVSSVSSSFI